MRSPTGLRSDEFLMAMPYPHPAPSVERTSPSLPFGLGAVTVLLIGALFTIVGIGIIVYAFFGFLTGTIGAATGGGGVMGIFSTMMGAVILFVIGGALAGIGGWLVRLWWIFLLVGVVAGSSANTARERDAMRTSEVRVRCQNCSRLNPEWIKFCMSCGKPV